MVKLSPDWKIDRYCRFQRGYDRENEEQPMGLRKFLAGLKVAFFGGLTVWKRLDNQDLGTKDEDRVDVRGNGDNCSGSVEES